ncbi:glycosyltransferase family 2 protein [Pseudarcicella hirudinis]|uniref:glycosyltransferase family 2 protein n=1 Tax=Pseudarcicella hirudinis TaxID=1079859 RepID=UPI000B82DC1D|nr:glycosyltransferase family 2 protein [Pseudarcicella hirudinis]
MKSLNVSIPLCTFNGERYIEKQLESIVQQSYLPFEVIIVDDNSSDHTISKIESFQHNLNIRIVRNSESLGVIKNFEKAISLCTGDIIAPCDQDDYWHPNKLEEYVSFFNKNPDSVAVFSNALIVDENLKELGSTFWQEVRFFEPQIAQWKAGDATGILLAGNRVAGCMFAFRKELLTYGLPFPTHIPKMIHDGWLALLATLVGKVGLIAEPLMSYRQHSQQQVGTRPQQKGEKIQLSGRFNRPRIEKLAPFLEKRDYFCLLKKALSGKVDTGNADFLKIEKSESFYEMRGTLSENKFKRVIPALKALLSGNYHHYKDQSANWAAPYKAFLGDILE